MSILVMSMVLIIISVLLILILRKKNERIYRLLKEFPSHPTYPLIGNLYLLMNPMDGAIEKLEKIVQPFDRQVFWFGPIPALILKKCDDIATVLNQCLDRDIMGIADAWTGPGILTGRYKEWRTSKRILSPAFSSEMLSKYLQVFNKNSSILTENIKSVADTDEYVDVWHWMMKGSLDSIIENVMGISIRNCDKNGQEYCNAVEVGLQSVMLRLQYPWLYSNFIYKLYLKITGKTRIIEHAKILPDQILNKLRGFQHESDTAEDANPSRTVIDLLIKKSLNEPEFTETRTRDDLSQTIGSGVETTAQNLSFLFLMLAIHQDIQQKVYEEITKLPTSDDHIDGVVTEDDLTNNLGYLEKCIKETLRLFSPVMADLRRTDKEISLGDKIVPANLLVMTHFYLANKDPELYQNPLKWDPEHFSDEAIKKRPKTSQLSFGYGPRYCLGAKYAMMAIKTQAVYIVRRYHLSTNIRELTIEDLHADLSIRSKFGYPIKFTSRRVKEELRT